MHYPGLCDVAIQRILKHDFRALLALRTVSKTFKDATCESDVWRNVDLSYFNNPLLLLADYGSMIRILALPGFIFDSLNLEMYCAQLVSLDMENTTVQDKLVLPKTLETLTISNGTFQKLDLSDFDALRVLHAVNSNDVIPPAKKNLEVVSARGTDCLTLSRLVGDKMRELTIQGDEEGHWELLACCKDLTSLTVFCAETLTDQFLPLLAALPLDTLRLTRASRVSGPAWADFIRKHKTTWKSFDVRESDGFNELACVTLADKFAVHGKHLRYLNLSWCFTLRDAAVMMILDYLPLLQVLKLKGLRHISYLALQAIFTKPYTRLQWLDVTSSDSIDDWYLELLHVVFVKKVDIDDFSMSETMRHAITRVYKENPASLHIRNYYGLEIEDFKPLPRPANVIREADSIMFPTASDATGT